MNNIFYCPGNITLFNAFDLSYAPSLLYYSYIPIVVASLFLAAFVLFKRRFSLESKLLFAIAVSFSFWVVNIMMQWVTVPAHLNYFEWQITPFIEILIPIFSLYFVVAFLERRDVGIKMKLFLSAVASSVFVLLPTNINAVSFDVLNCQANLGPLIYYVYGFEAFSVFFTVYLGIKKYRSSTDPLFKKQVLFLVSGVILFLGIFCTGQIFGEITKFYEINLIGPIGMLCFIGILAYMIVKYQTFNIKLFATQALVAGIAVLIGARLFYSTTTAGTILSAITLAGFLVSGYFLIKSVKGEIEQRERAERLAEQLSEFMSLATHEIRNPATFIKGSAAGALEGDLGELTPIMKDTMQKIFVRINDIIHLGNQYLDKSKLELNQIKFEFVPTDLSRITEDLVREFEPAAVQRGIAITSNIDKNQSYEVQADSGKIKEVIGNLIDNAIKYTKEGNGGTVAVSVTKGENAVTMKIADNGNGIPAETIPQLFKKFSRADAQKANLLGTGLGLYLAKIFIEAHHGKIWVESEGKDKGSTFFVELPIAQTSSSVPQAS